MISRARSAASGTLDEVVRRATAEAIISFRLPLGPVRLPRRIAATAGENGSIRVRTDDPTRTLFESTSWAIAQEMGLGDLTVQRPSLEDVYLELVGATA